MDWEKWSREGNEWGLCWSRFYLYFYYKLLASHSLCLISRCIFGTILSPLPVLFIFSCCFLELSFIALFTGLLNALQLWLSTVDITAQFIEGPMPNKSVGYLVESTNYITKLDFKIQDFSIIKLLKLCLPQDIYLSKRNRQDTVKQPQLEILLKFNWSTVNTKFTGIVTWGFDTCDRHLFHYIQFHNLNTSVLDWYCYF